jgi:rhodanese-related sulfurtransferase
MSRSIRALELKSLLERNVAITLLDLRRKADFDADPRIVPGARWLEHEKIGDWVGQLPRDREIVLYCAHGKTISNAALDRLLALGFKARFIEGGMDGWREAGGPTVPR